MTPENITDILAELEAVEAKGGKAAADTAKTLSWVRAMRERETRTPGRANFREYLREDFQKSLHDNGVMSGTVCEIGGPYNSFEKDMPDYKFEFLSLYPDKNFDNIHVGDACHCDHIPDASFDAIYSTSVFEHIAKPWLAADHLTRLLKPGGIMYHAAPFSYFYHGAPADFWRYTPDAFTTIFSGLRPVRAEFFGDNRRRDNRGSEVNAVDRDGGPEFAVDAFGGWRENWFTIYVGQKDDAHLAQVMATAKEQTVVNLMKCLTMAGMDEDKAATKLARKLKTVRVTRDQELFVCPQKESNFSFTKKDVLGMWNTRGRSGIRPSYNRFVMATRVGFDPV